MKTIRIGSGAGTSMDLIDPAVELVEQGNIDYICFECLAERTIGIGQQVRLREPDKGYDPLLEERMEAILLPCKKNNVKIITNMGAANPLAAMQRTKEVAERLGVNDIKIAALLGDDVVDVVRQGQFSFLENGQPVSSLGDKIISANAYLGCAGIVEALQNGADVIITGRVADPALFAAPLIHEFGWPMDDWHKMGIAACVGHLLECGGQASGGYFADPGVKDVPDLDRLGFPLAEVAEDGSFFITKVAGSGGEVSSRTLTEQILYEVFNPAAYYTPDVVADFSHIQFIEEAPDQVRVVGATGKKRPDTLKVSVGYLDGFIGEGQISYAGPGAVARGKLALDIVKKRLERKKIPLEEIRYDLIGCNSLHGNALSNGEPYEVRVRAAGRAPLQKDAAQVGAEVFALYTNGPVGGGGAWQSTKDVLAILSVLIPRTSVTTKLCYEEIQ